MSIDPEMMHTPRTVRLINGYTGTGKDTVGKHLNTGKGQYSWAIYKHPVSTIKFPRGDCTWGQVRNQS